MLTEKEMPVALKGNRVKNVIYLRSLKEFLPKEYIKQRGSEKKIFQVCTLHHSHLAFKENDVFETVGGQWEL